MKKPAIYVETTIPSAYLEERMDPEMVTRRLWTRQWWDRALTSSRLVTSPEVLMEVSQGSVSRAAARLALMAGVEVLPVNARVLEIAKVYVTRKVMPKNPVSDAVHLAV